MKTPLTIIGFLLIFISTFSYSQNNSQNKPTPRKAADFNDKIIDQTDAVIATYNVFIKTWQAYEYGNMDLSLLKKDFKTFKKQIKTSLDSLNLIEKFDNKNEFKNMAIKYILSYKSIADHEWAKIMKLLEKGGKFGKSDEEKCNKLAIKIDKKTGPADNKFIEFQKTFAKKYRFKLE